MTLNNCKIIGLTGGIATGKSTVSNLLIEKGYKLIDADKIAREVVEIDKPAYLKIVEEFGESILLEDKTIDRKALGNIIFNDNFFREKLNQITHPHIFKTIKLNIHKLCKEESIIFLDIPLLFEQFDLLKEYDIRFNEIVLVYVDEKTQIERLVNRDFISKEQAINKIRSQMPIVEKRSRSSKTIDNTGDIENLKKQVDILLLELI